jgi:hypothetical protein
LERDSLRPGGRQRLAYDDLFLRFGEAARPPEEFEGKGGEGAWGGPAEDDAAGEVIAGGDGEGIELDASR